MPLEVICPNCASGEVNYLCYEPFDYIPDNVDPAECRICGAIFAVKVTLIISPPQEIVTVPKKQEKQEEQGEQK